MSVTAISSNDILARSDVTVAKACGTESREGQHKLIAATDGREPQEAQPFSIGQGRIPALDGLRGIAILLVLLWHTIFEKSATSRVLTGFLSLGKLSWSGVDLFFVLSGFLIGGILLDATRSPNYYKTFYARRAFRILPLYALVVILLALVHFSFPESTGLYFQSLVPWIAYPIFAQNLWMAYLGTFGMRALTPTWSLAIEEQFYLTAPFVIRKLTRTRLAVLLGGVIIGAPLLRTFMVFNVPHGKFSSFFLTPCRADALSLGVLAALLVRNPQCCQILAKKRTILYLLTGGLLLILIWLTYWASDPYSAAMVTFGYSVLAFFYAGCLLIALLRTRIGERVLRDRRLMQLGGIAYCTYLVHMPFLNAGEWAFDSAFRYWGLSFSHSSGWAELIGRICGVAVTLFVARLSWRSFEQPLLKRGHRYKY